MDDARRLLEDAVRERRSCRLSRVGGPWAVGTLCRLEPSGVVCNVPGHELHGGEEVRLWFEEQGRPQHFEASVLRVGVPVPDRGAHGVLLGFLSLSVTPPPVVPATEATVAQEPVVLEVRLASGGAVSLAVPPIEVVELAPDRVEFQVPRSFAVVFPENGLLWMRWGISAADSYEVRGRVALVAPGEAHHLYAVEVEQVERPDLHPRTVPVLRAALVR